MHIVTWPDWMAAMVARIATCSRGAGGREASDGYSILDRIAAGNKTEEEPLMNFANGEILIQRLRLIGSGAKLGRRLIAAERQGLVQVLPSAISGPKLWGEGD